MTLTSANLADGHKLLDALRKADADHWSQPSNAGALRVHHLEQEYEQLTGQSCPAWPQRIAGGAA